MFTIKSLAGLVSFAALLGILTPQARAALTIEYRICPNSGTCAAAFNLVVTTPTGETDSGPFTGTLGAFKVTGLDATSTSPGAPDFAEEIGNTTTITNITGSTSTIEFLVTAHGFMNPVSPVLLTSEINGNVPLLHGATDNSLTFFSCVGGTTCDGGSTNAAGPVKPTITSPGSYTGTESTTLGFGSFTTPYNVLEGLRITLGGSQTGTGTGRHGTDGSSISFNATATLTTVPEPTSIALLGGVLLLTTRVIRRKFKANA